MKKYIKLMRVHHYLKNGLIFLPLLFGGEFYNVDILKNVVLGFLAFSFTASIIYIINDIFDVEKDRLHEVKKNRPIASGEVSIKNAWILTVFLAIAVVILNYLACASSVAGWLLIIFYVLINIGYSLGLKNVPLLDIAILVSGFIVRLLYGSVVADIEISNWLYLTVMSVSFYFGLGKRRNETIKQGSSSRKVLQFYNQNFLDKNMYMCLSLAIVFYSLWCTDPNTISLYNNNAIIWTIPLIILICMKYSLNIEGNSHGDPIDVILHDKTLLAFIFIYGILLFCIIYGNTFLKMLV
ncbi:MAG: UbiA prenyltransferase family protein [Bacilli bacterium]|nr:UbiA prenyltransferase family protein [Bacilli bacterium]MDD3305244.1 UbiA prenyltransferase family protein [Bacilli bacterium]MDD4053967.1 UbiA prenyltransferase family protein [Bacilli bacterium]MDD4411433.1 UbiA prenyltransferase family protein [Bacilli bacterium]